MSIKSDFHVHSTFSGDAHDSMEDMIKKGIEMGLTSICFTEHQDIDYDYKLNEEEEGLFDLNTDAYLYDLLKLRAKYASDINVLFGVEIGVQPHLRRELALYAKAYDFDFIIASAHLIDGYDPYNKVFKDAFPSDEENYRNYFKTILEDLKVFSNFDVFGHLDYIVRVGNTKDQFYSYDKYKDVIDPILTKLIDMEKGIEINTGALRKGMRETNPCKDIIKKYRELGGEIITIGSDAHSIDELAYRVDQAGEILKECGFKYYATFEKRVAEMHKL